MTFTVPGEPVAWARARVQRHARGLRFFKGEDQTTYGALCALVMKQAMEGRPPLDGPLTVRIEAVWPCPKGRERVRTPRPSEPKATKPDADNLGKQIGDAGNGIVWRDDAQIAHLEVRKRVGAQGEAPRVEVRVEPHLG